MKVEKLNINEGGSEAKECEGEKERGGKSDGEEKEMTFSQYDGGFAACPHSLVDADVRRRTGDTFIGITDSNRIGAIIYRLSDSC